MIHKLKKFLYIIIIGIITIMINVRDVHAASIGRVGDHWEGLNGAGNSYNETFSGFKFSNTSNLYVDGDRRPTNGVAWVQGLYNVLNQSTTGNGAFSLDCNQENVQAFFEKNPRDMVNKYIGSGVFASYSNLGMNGSCWHAWKGTGEGNAVLVESIIDIKPDGVYVSGVCTNGNSANYNNKIYNEKALNNSEEIQKMFCKYFSNYWSFTESADGNQKNHMILMGFLNNYLYQLGNYKDYMPILNANNAYADINMGSINESMFPKGYKNYEIRMILCGQIGGQEQVAFAIREARDVNPDTGRIRTIKYDQYNPSVRLNGAKFILYNNDEKKYVSKTSQIGYQNGQYMLKNIEYTDSSNQAAVFLSGGKDRNAQEGYLDIINIPIPKGENGSYNLIEIEAPSNYNVKELSNIAITVKKYDDDSESNDRYNRKNRLIETMNAYDITGYESLLNKYENISNWADKDNDAELKVQQSISKLRGKKDKNDENYYIMSDRYKDAKTLLLYSQSIGYSTGSILKNGNKNENGSLRIIKTSKIDSDTVIGGAKYVLYDEQGNCVTHNTSDTTGKYKALWKSSRKEMDTVAKASSDTAYPNKAIFETDANGIIDIENLDTDHTYTLHEIEAPTGYYKAEDKTDIKVNSFGNNGKCTYEYFRDTMSKIIGNDFNKQEVIDALCITLNENGSSYREGLWKSSTSYGILNETFLYKGFSDFYNATIMVKRANLLNNIDDFSDEESRNIVKDFVLNFYNNYKGTDLTSTNAVIQMYHKMLEGWTCEISEETPKKGNLEIYKVDSKYKKELNEIGFTIKNKSITDGYDKTNEGKYVTGNGTYSSSSKTFKTNTNGKITVKNLVPGIYTITEVSLPEGVKEKVFKTGHTEDIEVKPGETGKPKNGKVENTLTGEAQLLKIDGLTGEKLSGFKFRIYLYEKGWVKFKEEDNQCVYDGVTDHYKDATDVVTGDNGYTKLMINMPIYENAWVYERGGDNIPNAYKEKYKSLFSDQHVLIGEGPDYEWAKEPVRECCSFRINEYVKDYELENNEFSSITAQQIIVNTDTPEDTVDTKTVTLEKPVGKMELEGFAFIDTDKEQKNDGLFNDGTNGVYNTTDINDKPMPNVPVKIMKNGTQIATTKTNNKGEYKATLDVSSINNAIYQELKDVENQITNYNDLNKALAARANELLSSKKTYEETKNKAKAERENLQALINEAKAKGSTLNVAEYTNKINELDTIISTNSDELSNIDDQVNSLKNQIEVNYTKAKELADGYEKQFNDKFNDKMEAYLKDVKVVFTYDGVEYESTERYDVSFLSYTACDPKKLVTEDENHNGAVSIVEETTRESFNNDFSEITGEGQTIRGTKVTYTPYSYDGDFDAVGIKASGNFDINAETPNESLSTRYAHLRKEGGYYSANKIGGRLEKIDRINLGVYKRVKPNMSLEVNLSQAKVNVNSKEMTYKYGDNPEEKPGTPQVQWEKLFSDINADLNERYNLPVYPSDVKDTTSTGSTFNCEVQYRIRLVNSSGGGLATTINAIDDYFSDEYTFKALYMDGHEIGTKVEKENRQSDDDSSKKYCHYTFSNLGIEIPATGSNYKDLYIVFNITSDKLYNKDKDEFIFNGLVLRNRAEISSYTIKKDNKVYAGFDYNSVPNNFYTGTIDAGNTKYDKTKEDDCRYGKGLCLFNAGERTISGVVFEDESEVKETSSGKERNGNGKYDSGEKAISEVTVTLYRNGVTEPIAVTKTTNGAYEFNGFAAGDYYVEFTWGDKDIHSGDSKYSPAEYKSTIVKDGLAEDGHINGEATRWYATLNGESVAVDKAEDRIAFENKVKAEAGTLYRDLNTLDATDIENKLYGTIHARTRLMDMRIENMDEKEKNMAESETLAPYKAINVDFGITKRPVPDMQIKKTVKHVKFVDGQGRTLADSDVENGKLTETDLNYVVALPASEGNPFGTIKAEADYYPIEVETQYEVKVINNSEVDYYYKGTESNKLTHYYYYGVVDENTDGLITMTPEDVYDYLNEGYQVNTIDNPEVKVITTDLTGTKEEATKTTVLEKAYEKHTEKKDMYGNTIDENIYKTERGIIEKIFEEWTAKESITNIKQKKIDKTKVIKLESLLHEYNPGASDSVGLTATSTIAATIDEVNLSNEAEITDVKENSYRTSTPHKSYVTYGDAAQRITITPPTGENRDKTPTYILTISAIVVLIVIGTGIIVIKKNYNKQ